MKKILFIGIVILFTLTSCGLVRNQETPKEVSIDNNITTTSITDKEVMQDDLIKEEIMIDDIETKDIMNDSDKKNTIKNDDTVKKDTMVDNKGTYQVYDKSKLSSTKNNVLFFAATWCPTCRGADKNLSSETIPENLNILKVDYDTYTDLKKKYGITIQHTFVLVDKDLNMIKKWSGSTNSQDILSKIN